MGLRTAIGVAYSTLVARADSGIITVDDLRGKAVAVPFASTYIG